MEELTRQLLNDYQRDFPLDPAPFAAIAARLNTDAETVLRRLRELQGGGTVSRIGAVFRPNTVGASTLAAMAVEPERLEAVAAQVSGFAQVNHNYEREHRFNLWFVVTARDARDLQAALRRIQRECGYRILSLPLVRDYHIDLGFRMQLDDSPEPVAAAASEVAGSTGNELLAGRAEDLIEAIQDGLPLVARPYLAIAQRLGWREQQVIDHLREMIEAGVIKRLGVVVRHHELGYRANAMVVWNIPDTEVDRVGERLGRQDCVTLCYRRPRRPPDWPYNLFCMVHGRDRDAVLDCIRDMRAGLGLEHVPCAVLFSGRRFKQRGARYRAGH